MKYEQAKTQLQQALKHQKTISIPKLNKLLQSMNIRLEPSESIEVKYLKSEIKKLRKQLMEQVERVEELELELNDWRAEVQKWQQFYKESEESHLETKELLKSIVNQNKRYREALKNIYELAEYDEYDNTLEQIVSEIKKALEETK